MDIENISADLNRRLRKMFYKYLELRFDVDLIDRPASVYKKDFLKAVRINLKQIN